MPSSDAEGAPLFYTLEDVRCPGTAEFKGAPVPCTALWDRREVAKDRAVHQVVCWRCKSRILYHLDDNGALVVLLIESREQWAVRPS